MAGGLTSCGRTYRAQRAVLHVVHRQLHLRVLADVGVLEKGDAAEVGGVTAALRTNQNTPWFSKDPVTDANSVSAATRVTRLIRTPPVAPPIIHSHRITKGSAGSVSDTSGAAAAAEAPR